MSRSKRWSHSALGDTVRTGLPDELRNWDPAAVVSAVRRRDLFRELIEDFDRTGKAHGFSRKPPKVHLESSPSQCRR